jgi:hypothetical protein
LVRTAFYQNTLLTCPFGIIKAFVNPETDFGINLVQLEQWGLTLAKVPLLELNGRVDSF